MNITKKKSKHKILNDFWTFTTYFTEGFPYVMIRSVFFVFFRDLKGSLEAIGVLSSFFQLPWIIKFLWGPWVDEYSSKRRWLLSMQGLIGIVFFLAVFFIPLGKGLQWIPILFVVGSFLAATHDIAIDGYYMEALNKDGQAKYVGIRVMAYQIARIAGTGGIVTIGAIYGWFQGFLAAAILFAFFFIYHLFFLKEIQSPKKSISSLITRTFRPKPLLIIISVIVIVGSIRFFFQSSYYQQLQEQVYFLKKVSFAHWVALLLFIGLALVGIFRNRIKAIILKDPDSYYGRAFVSFMDREKIAIILGFIILLRAGEWTLSVMVSPFIVDVGIKVHYGWISAAVGLPAAIVGALLGGAMISRFSLKKVLWPFIILTSSSALVLIAMKSFK